MSFGNGYNGGRTSMTTKVILNIYDLSPSNEYLYPIGMGLHHSGVEVSGREYSYGSQGGIYEGPPRDSGGAARFRSRIELGAFDGGGRELTRALDELRHNGGFGSTDYNLVRKNCNHFCNALVYLLLKRPIPAYVNRLAGIGDFCSCLLPKELLEDSPVNGNGGGSPAPPSSGFMSRGGRVQTTTTTTTNKVASFTGKGYSLAGGKSSSSSSSSSSPGGQPDLTDRRERARKAALARLEQQSHSSGHQ